MNALLTSLNTENPLDARLEQIIEAAIARLQAGETIDLAALAAEHPEYAAELNELLPTVARLVRLGDLPPPNAAPKPGEPAQLPYERLGDFRILREIGRGGMGVVYEADQLSMGRKVALKVLPFAALVQDKSLQRFHNEVRAAAALDHAHIVPIYSVGEDRGVHYYAMQLVRGQSLAQAIEELRTRNSGIVEQRSSGVEQKRSRAVEQPSSSTTPLLHSSSSAPTRPIAALSTTPPLHHSTSPLSPEYFRSAARLGIQAAEALQHAHDLGVLHRDIKPSNLMVECTHLAPRDDTATGATREAKPHHAERDGYTPKLWITDFGLARIGADAGLTMTGDIIGTLRYMAPEQALTKRIVIDHRADVYSLGATLYELLTLEPAFGETDRSELLKQIAFEDPRPPRKLQRRIPSELETIVLKAMAKEPEARYQTAQHLADDLRAFLDVRPIKARPPSWGDRVWKWSRRHQSLVRTAGLACLLVGVIAAVGVAMVIRAHTRTVAALEETSDLLYTTDMRLAYETFEKGWSDEVQTILDRYRPAGQGPDRRGYEWHLLQKLVEPPGSFALAGHEGSVNELAVFPDRQRLASVGDDGTLRIWNVRERRLLRTIPLCNKPLYSVAISPDGQYVAAGSDILYLCDLKAEEQVTELHHAKTNIESLVFSPDGEQLAVGSRYEDVCLLSLDGEVLECLLCASSVDSLEYVTGSPLLLVPNRRFPERVLHPLGYVQIWDDALSKVQGELDPSHDDYCGRITMARSSLCGRYVVAGEKYGGRVFIFERASGRVLAETAVSRDRVHDVACSPDGNAIALGYRNGRLEYFTLKEDAAGAISIGPRPIVADAHQGEIHALRFVDATSLATCGADGLIRVWGIAAKAATVYEFSPGQMHGMRLSPDGRHLLCTSPEEATIVDVERREVVCRLRPPAAGHNLPAWSPAAKAWSPAGDKAAVCDRIAGSVTIFDITGQTICAIAHRAPLDVAFSPDGTLLAVISAADFQMYRTDTGAAVLQRPTPIKGSTIAFSHAGAHVAYGGDFGPVTILDLNHMRPLHELSCGSSLECLAFSPDDAIVASGHGDGNIRLWDVHNGRLRAELIGHEQRPNVLVFPPDGHTLLSSANDGTIRIWSVKHGRGYGVVYRGFGPGPPYGTCELSLSADGGRLAVGHRALLKDRRDVLLWDIELTTTN